MQHLTDVEKKAAYTKDLAVMHSEYYSYRQFEEAAIRIGEQRTYEAAGYSSFDAFHLAEFPDAHRISKRKYQLLKFIEVRDDVARSNRELVENEILPILPANERQTRELASLDPDERGAAWALAQETTGKPQPSGREVAEVVAAVKPSRLDFVDTHPGPKPAPAVEPPPPPPLDLPRKAFRVGEFTYNDNYQTVYFFVNKPENKFKGWAAKKEPLKIKLVDLMWELRKIGFQLKRIGTDAADENGDMPTDDIEEELALIVDKPESPPPSPPPTESRKAAITRQKLPGLDFFASDSQDDANHEEAIAVSFIAGKDFSDIDALATSEVLFPEYPQ